NLGQCRAAPLTRSGRFKSQAKELAILSAPRFWRGAQTDHSVLVCGKRYAAVLEALAHLLWSRRFQPRRLVTEEKNPRTKLIVRNHGQPSSAQRYRLQFPCDSHKIGKVVPAGGSLVSCLFHCRGT